MDLFINDTDSDLKKDKNYNPQVFLEECKKMERFIKDDLEISYEKVISEKEQFDL